MLEAALRQAAFFKINGFALKLEGHFQYRSAPAIVEPYALSPRTLQRLTDCARRYHVQLIPYLDAPAHDSFILKHPEYAGLRAFPDCNYEFCVVNPNTLRLFFGLFDDLLAATRGGQYFFLSTDEPYYVGLAHGEACDEAARARALGSVGKVLAQFVTQSAAFLRARGRTVLFWGEYPLTPADIPALPPDLVNGETYGPDFDPVFKAHGIRQLLYTSAQGEEALFPNYYLSPDARARPPARDAADRVTEMFRTFASPTTRRQADLMGAFVAAWADAGLHPETFWLGYATGGAFAWNPSGPTPDNLRNEFYRLFYGAGADDLGRVYELLGQQARFWEESWETAPSGARTPIFGNSQGPFHPPRPAQDQRLPPLPVPRGADLSLDVDWSVQNASRLALARAALVQNDELLARLRTDLARVEFHRYGLRVFQTIAQLCRQNLELLLDLDRINEDLKATHQRAARDPAGAIQAVDAALDLAAAIWRERNRVLQATVTTWDQSWFPRVASAHRRHYLDAVDDVKDHRPVRTVDMSYLIYRELLYPLGEWADAVLATRNQIATGLGREPRLQTFCWTDTASPATKRVTPRRLGRP